MNAWFTVYLRGSLGLNYCRQDGFLRQVFIVSSSLSAMRSKLGLQLSVLNKVCLRVYLRNCLLGFSLAYTDDSGLRV